VSNSKGKARLIGALEEVDKLLDAARPDTFIRAVNAL
jgi:hypothetical protein